MRLIPIQAQQELVEFADGLHGFLRFAITVQGLANLWNLFWTEAHLAGLAAGITDVKDPEGMAFAANAFGTAAGVMNGALEQRAAEDIAELESLAACRSRLRMACERVIY